MLKAGHVDLRNVVKLHPTDTLVRSVARPRKITNMGVSVKVQLHILWERQDIPEQLRRSASARKRIMGRCDNRTAVLLHFLFYSLQQFDVGIPFTYYFPKNPAGLGKSEEVRGKK